MINSLLDEVRGICTFPQVEWTGGEAKWVGERGTTFVHLSHLVFVGSAHPEERSFTDLVGGPLIYFSSQLSPLACQLATSPASWGALALCFFPTPERVREQSCTWSQCNSSSAEGRQRKKYKLFICEVPRGLFCPFCRVHWIWNLSQERTNRIDNVSGQKVFSMRGHKTLNLVLALNSLNFISCIRMNVQRLVCISCEPLHAPARKMRQYLT